LGLRSLGGLDHHSAKKFKEIHRHIQVEVQILRPEHKVIAYVGGERSLLACSDCCSIIAVDEVAGCATEVTYDPKLPDKVFEGIMDDVDDRNDYEEDSGNAPAVVTARR
jgi:hypothetical protein